MIDDTASTTDGGGDTSTAFRMLSVLRSNAGITFFAHCSCYLLIWSIFFFFSCSQFVLNFHRLLPSGGCDGVAELYMYIKSIWCFLLILKRPKDACKYALRVYLLSARVFFFLYFCCWWMEVMIVHQYNATTHVLAQSIYTNFSPAFHNLLLIYALIDRRFGPIISLTRSKREANITQSARYCDVLGSRL